MNTITSKKSTAPIIVRYVIVISLILLIFVFTHLYNYLLFHIIAVLFNIILSLGIFILAWNSARLAANNFFIFIGIAYLFITIVEFDYMLAFQEMNILPGFGTNTATQLWILARYIEAITILIAFFLANKKTNPAFVFISYTVVLTISFISIFYFKNFPVLYIEGSGTTAFKIASEYTIIALFGASIFLLLFRNRRLHFNKKILGFLISALLASMFSEFLLIFFKNTAQYFDFFAHILKITSLFLICKAILENGLINPFNVIYKNLEESETKFKNLVNMLPEIVLEIDKSGNIMFINKAGLNISGYDEEDLSKGINISDILVSEDYHKYRTNVQMIQSGIFIGITSYHVRKKNGDVFPVLVNRNVIHNKAGEYSGLILVAMDISEQKKIENAIRDSEMKFRTIFELSPIPMTEEDYSGVKLILDDLKNSGIRNMKKYLDEHPEVIKRCYEKVKIISLNKAALNLYNVKNKSDAEMGLRNIFLPDTVETFKEYLISISKGRMNFESETINRTQSGKKKNIYMKIFALPGYTKTLERVIFAMIDLTNIKKAEYKLKENFKKYRLIFENSLDGTYRSTIDGRYLEVNRALVKLLGYKNKRELMAISIPKQLYVNSSVRPQVHDRNRVFEAELYKKDGTKIWAEISSTVVEENNKTKYYLGSLRDNTQRKLYEEEIKYLSFHDKLTGLYNRSYFEEELKRLDTKRQLPVSIVIGDINGLKLINDTFGHYHGDNLIVKIAEILKDIFRDEDIICRWGGDEFAILLPNTEKNIAIRITERVKNACKKNSKDTLPLSISMGVATKTIREHSIGKIIKMAEDKMYKSKLLDSKNYHSAIIKSLERTLEERNYETTKHINRMKEYAVEMGKKLKLPQNKINDLTLLASLHDIGKISIPEDIMLKQSKLTCKEWEIMKKHPEIGYRITSTSVELESISKSILAHHEWYNGSGYPKGIKGKEIPLSARIISVLDAFDAMTHKRPHRKAQTSEYAIRQLQEFSGVQFDPKIVKVFLSIIS